MSPEPASVRKLNRDQRAELHYTQRAGWLRVTLRGSGAQAFGIASLSDPTRIYLCNGDGCTCPDFKFRGLSGLRIGHGGAHLPCSHLIAVRRVLKDAQATIAESRSHLTLIKGTE